MPDKARFSKSLVLSVPPPSQSLWKSLLCMFIRAKNNQWSYSVWARAIVCINHPNSSSQQGLWFTWQNLTHLSQLQRAGIFPTIAASEIATVCSKPTRQNFPTLTQVSLLNRSAISRLTGLNRKRHLKHAWAVNEFETRLLCLVSSSSSQNEL